MKAKIGVIGLATMGANLSRNFLSRNISIALYNRTGEKTKALLDAFPDENAIATFSLVDFVHALETPRKILLMVKAGDAVDEIIDALIPLLKSGDIVIDGGNSYFEDTIRREKKSQEKGIHFIGCGISGGEEGALHGPSLMPGGSLMAWKEIAPFFERIAAKDFEGHPCVTFIGPGGSGHYVKMIHNGIEYALLQVIAEAYDILKKTSKKSPVEIANVFERYQQGSLNSYLLDIAIHVLRKKDPKKEGFLIDAILDRTEQKGTGKWAVIDSLHRGLPVPSIAEAVFTRSISGMVSERNALHSIYPKKEGKEISALETILEKALLGSFISIFAQGFELLRRASEEMGWNSECGEIARIWQGGCIIRAILLKEFRHAITQGKSILEDPQIAALLNTSLEDWKKLMVSAIQSDIPISGFSSAFHFLSLITSTSLPMNLIAGMRDYFGAHGFERRDLPGSFHILWNEFYATL